MKVVVTKQFDKDVNKELDKPMKLEVVDLIGHLQKAGSLQEVANLKKLKGHKAAFRIKMGNYRIGFIFKADKIILSRVMNRKDIYKYFP